MHNAKINVPINEDIKISKMTKCELETELIGQMRNANLLRYQFIQLLTQSKSTVRSEKGKTLVGQLNCVRGWGKSMG